MTKSDEMDVSAVSAVLDDFITFAGFRPENRGVQDVFYATFLRIPEQK